MGLLINTVPVRASITPATTTADLLDQLQSARTTTPSSISIWRSARSTASPATTSCSTPSSCTRTTPWTKQPYRAADDLTITEFTARDYYHYPLAVQAQPGRELGLHVQFRTDIFDLASIEALIERLQRIFLTMVADPHGGSHRLIWSMRLSTSPRADL